METLIQRIANSADINEETARKAVLQITLHVKEKYPLLQSIVDLILENENALKADADQKKFDSFPKNLICMN